MLYVRPTSELLANSKFSLEEKVSLAVRYWSTVGLHITEWNKVKNGNMKSSDVRKNYICSLSITLVALGHAGNALINTHPDDWHIYLDALDAIDWSKNNPIWENLVFLNGKVAANRSTQRAMSSYMKDILLETAGTQNG